MAAEGHAAAAPTAGEYIIHHLQHAQNGKMSGIVDFSVVNLDSVFFSVLLGVLGCGIILGLFFYLKFFFFLAVVLLILGMIAGLAGPQVMKYLGESKTKAAKLAAAQIR